MTGHAATFGPENGFDQQPMKGYFVKSAIFHAVLFVVILGWNFFDGDRESFGDPNAGGPSMGINIVESIPIPTKGLPNPLANDTDSVAPQAPPEELVAEPEPEPPPVEREVVEIETPKEVVTQQEAASRTQRFRPFDQLKDNQVTSKSAPQVSNPMFSERAGSGRISTGENTTLGNRCGGYAAIVRDKVSQNWQTATIAAGITTAPPAIASFEIERRGAAQSFRLLQSSGNTALDLTIERAVKDSSPFPPLPTACANETARVEFIFNLKR